LEFIALGSASRSSLLNQKSSTSQAELKIKPTALHSPNHRQRSDRFEG
jgi:hypothetical protein